MISFYFKKYDPHEKTCFHKKKKKLKELEKGYFDYKNMFFSNEFKLLKFLWIFILNTLTFLLEKSCY